MAYIFSCHSVTFSKSFFKERFDIIKWFYHDGYLSNMPLADISIEKVSTSPFFFFVCTTIDPC